MSNRPKTQGGPQLRWTATGVAVSLRMDLQTTDFAETQPVDEQMDDTEKRRLLYVAATRARDHLVVSLRAASSLPGGPVEERPRAASELVGQLGGDEVGVGVGHGVELGLTPGTDAPTWTYTLKCEEPASSTSRPVADI